MNEKQKRIQKLESVIGVSNLPKDECVQTFISQQGDKASFDAWRSERIRELKSEYGNISVNEITWIEILTFA